jgi:hypothetical protein
VTPSRNDCTSSAILRSWYHSSSRECFCYHLTSPKVYHLTFMYSSTCFGRPHAHHQELNNCSSSLWFYHWIVVVAVLLVVVGAADPDRPRPTALLPPRSNGKIRGCYCICWAPDDGREDARNMLSCTQTSSNNLEEFLHLVGWFIWNVNSQINRITHHTCH